MFLDTQLCEKKRKLSLVRIPSIFSNVFIWASRRRAIESSWHLHSIYPILAGGCYLPHNLDTYLKWPSLIKNRISRHVWLKTYLRCSDKIPIPKLIFKNRRIKAYFDAYVYYFLSFQAILPFFYCLHGLALHAITMHCRPKSARIAHHNTLTV